MAMTICKEDVSLIENYDLAKDDGFKGWQLHHRLETHFSDGTPRPKNAQISAKELIALGAYYNRPANELIYMRQADHVRLHHKDKIVTQETKRRQSESLKGRRLSEETKRKIGEAHKGKETAIRCY